MRALMSNLINKHGAKGHDFGPSPGVKAAAVGAGVFAVSTAAGYAIGREQGSHYGPNDTIEVHRSYFVKTGTETYMGTCSGRTSGGESFSFDCPKVRDVGYYQPYTTQENARSYLALRGVGIGAAVGAVGGVLAAIATHALTRDLV